MKGLISERQNLVPAGLGNNTSQHDTSLLLDQDNEASTPDHKDDPFSGDELNDDDKDNEDGIKSFNAGATKHTKAGVMVDQPKKGNSTNTKKEDAMPANQKSRVDRIADTEIARLGCKKAKFDTKQQRLRTFEAVASVKGREETRRAVEVRQAELAAEKERVKMEYEYRMEMFRLGHTAPSPPKFTESLRVKRGRRWAALGIALFAVSAVKLAVSKVG